MALTQVPSTMIDRALATIASATTTDLSTTTSENVSVTGTTTITALGTLPAGAMRYITFAGALTFTHNATSLILPGGANITTAAGDVATLISLGSGNWRCVTYTKASGQAVVASATYVGPGSQVFSSSGTFTIPAGITKLKVTVVGGGGGGGSYQACNGYGSGAGAGGTAIKSLTTLTPGGTLAVTVGAAGSTGSANTDNATAGGTSSVASGTQTISTISATGGAKGRLYNLGVGAGGSASGGDLNVTGSNGTWFGYQGGSGGFSALGAVGKGGNNGENGGVGTVIFEW